MKIELFVIFNRKIYYWMSLIDLPLSFAGLIIFTSSRIQAIQFFFSARRVPVPDARYDYLCEYFKPAR